MPKAMSYISNGVARTRGSLAKTPWLVAFRAAFNSTGSRAGKPRGSTDDPTALSSRALPPAIKADPRFGTALASSNPNSGVKVARATDNPQGRRPVGLPTDRPTLVEYDLAQPKQQDEPPVE